MLHIILEWKDPPVRGVWRGPRPGLGGQRKDGAASSGLGVPGLPDAPGQEAENAPAREEPVVAGRAGVRLAQQSGDAVTLIRDGVHRVRIPCQVAAGHARIQ